MDPTELVTCELTTLQCLSREEAEHTANEDDVSIFFCKECHFWHTFVKTRIVLERHSPAVAFLPDRPVFSCYEKNRYRDKQEAQRNVQRVFKLRGHVVRYYCCSFCGGYHLTSRVLIEKAEYSGN